MAEATILLIRSLARGHRLGVGRDGVLHLPPFGAAARTLSAAGQGKDDTPQRADPTIEAVDTRRMNPSPRIWTVWCWTSETRRSLNRNRRQADSGIADRPSQQAQRARGTAGPSAVYCRDVPHTCAAPGALDPAGRRRPRRSRVQNRRLTARRRLPTPQTTPTPSFCRAPCSAIWPACRKPWPAGRTSLQSQTPAPRRSRWPHSMDTSPSSTRWRRREPR